VETGSFVGGYRLTHVALRRVPKFECDKAPLPIPTRRWTTSCSSPGSSCFPYGCTSTCSWIMPDIQRGFSILYRSGEEYIAPVLCCKACAVHLPHLLCRQSPRSASPPRGYWTVWTGSMRPSTQLEGRSVLRSSPSGRTTLERKEGDVILLLPALPHEGVELLQE
jgi:hypothetical protein